MIAIAVAASLVAYAWVMGYLGGTTTKVGKAVLIQSMAPDQNGDLVVYVQNVGVGAVTVDSVYVKDNLIESGLGVQLLEGETATIPVGYPVVADERVKVKVVTTDGTFSEITDTVESAVSVVQYQVDFVLGSGGLSMSPSGSHSYAAGAVVSLSATPDATHEFSQWMSTGSIVIADPNSASTSATINGAGTITTTFSTVQYSVDFILGSGGASMSPSGTQSYDVGASVPISATPDGTHTFSQWTSTGSITFDNANAASTTAHIDGSGSITANFALVQYSVDFVLGSGGASMNPSGTQSYGAGASVPITATPDGTYTFSQWTSTGSITFDNANAASTTAHIDGSGSITANFALAQYDVNFVLGGGGSSMSPTPGVHTYDAGASVAISATPDSTHTFSQWSATGSITFDDANAASTNAHINGAGTITANFALVQYDVNFVLGSGGASMSPTPGVHTYGAGDSVPITATPDGTHTFSQWTSTGSITFDNANAASTTAHINGAGTITANFAAVPTRQTIFTDDFESGWKSQWPSSLRDHEGITTSTYHSSSHSAWIDGDDDGYITLQISTTGYTSIQLSYWRMFDRGGSSSDSLIVEWRVGTSGSWTNLETLTVTNDVPWGQPPSAPLNLGASADGKATIQIRFRMQDCESGDYGYIDDVLVTGLV
jgi:hypothetical protein